MNNVIPPLNLINLAESLGNDKLISGLIQEFPDVLTNLKPGQNMLLHVVANNPILEQGKALLNTSILNVQVKVDTILKDMVINLDKSISLPKDDNNTLAVKITATNSEGIKVRVQSINNQPPETFVVKNTSMQPTQSVSEMIVKPVVNFKPNIDVSVVKPEQVLNLVKNDIPLPQAKLENLIKEFSTLGLKFEIGPDALSQRMILPKNFLPAIKEAIQNNDFTLDNKVNAEQVKNIFEGLKDTAVKAMVSKVIDDKTYILKTPMGESLIKSDIKLGLELGREIYISLKELVDVGVKADIKALPLKESVLEILKNLPPKLANVVASRIPDLTAAKFAENFVTYIKAANLRDINVWLGDGVVEEIASRGAEGREVAGRLSSLMTSNVREVGAWRIVEVPYMLDNNMKSVKVAIKRDNDTDGKKNKIKQGSRFIIDTTFTALGEIQFDGYAIEKEKRFDLIIRTGQDIGEDLCSNIMQLFKIAVAKMEYNGKIKINVKENFVKIVEEETCLPKGYYI